MDGLNPQQHAAVHETQRPLLIVAGAGSGKTRVITEKIVHLIRQGLPAKHIAALTFTNKAAREMKSRVLQKLDSVESRGLTVSTFHALGLELIRKEHAALGFTPALSVFDEQDRIQLLKELIKHHFEGDNSDTAPAVSQEISRLKGLFQISQSPIEPGEVQDCSIPALYALYTQQMRAYNAVDFDDLILLPVVLLRDHPDILERWQNKIRYLLVDEYQDTNETQYQLLKLLVGRIGRFTVVGDDDQSIYSWRGAQPENLTRILEDFPDLQIIKLEQNYRSCRRILEAANQLIAQNPHAIEKKLWSRLPEGEPLFVMETKDEVHESRQVCADLVLHRFKSGARYADYAILYRSNHQSRVFETALREAGIPYFITGGQSFFNAVEIKDVLAYLRLLRNPADDSAFLRIVNVPRREIGPVTLERLGAYAKTRRRSLLEAIPELGAKEKLGEAPWRRLTQFRDRLLELDAKIRASEDPIRDLRSFLEAIDYGEWLKETSGSPETGRKRNEHVEELLSWLERLLRENDTAGSGGLDEVLAKILLLDLLDRQQQDEPGDRVNVMTLHASKGLEFEYVYLVGMEENLLPHENSLSTEALEEERRLAYVGLTRARQKLTLSYCSHRKRRGELEIRTASRFLSELPESLLDWPARKGMDPDRLKERGQDSINQMRSLLKNA
jgi:ATP-dependent DNA helicase Rep